MNSPEYILSDDTQVVTHAALESTRGMSVNPIHLGNRKPDAPGVIVGVVPGHGGDVYWVNHGSTENPEIAAYCFTEFELKTDD